MSRPFLAPLTAVAMCGLFAGSAAATPDYPAVVQQHLSLKTAPSCTLCHTSPSGGSGNVTQPFGAAMKGHGMHSGDATSVAAALDQLETAAVDSDGDGEPDVNELLVGTNPNVPDVGQAPQDPVQYGFGCSQLAPDGLAAFAGLAALVGWRRRRRRV